eukprot:1782906-Rhodomonas_salina.1
MKSFSGLNGSADVSGCAGGPVEAGRQSEDRTTNRAVCQQILPNMVVLALPDFHCCIMRAQHGRHTAGDIVQCGLAAQTARLMSSTFSPHSHKCRCGRGDSLET